MELSKLTQKLSAILKKYRYVILIIVIGLVLMAIPTTGIVKHSPETSEIIPEETSSLEDRLSEILSLVDGAGEVRVILTAATGEETVYQMDEAHSSSDNSVTDQLDTVTVTAADRSINGLVKQVNPQTFQGAVVICSGANDPTVKLALVDAVAKLTGLGANQISVLKMK